MFSFSAATKKKKTNKNIFNSPASEFIFAQTHFEAIATRIGAGAAFDIAVEFVALHSVDAPCPRARPNGETRFLGVNCEHGKL